MALLKRNRKETTHGLTEACLRYWLPKNYSSHVEVALSKRRSIRADVISFNMKQEIVITEIKSCKADYTTDTKWREYVKYADRMYFAITQELYDSDCGKTIVADAKEHGVGVMVASPYSFSLTVKHPAKKLNNAEHDFKFWLFTKLCWRTGYSKATTTRAVKPDTPRLKRTEFLLLPKKSRVDYLMRFPKSKFRKILNNPILKQDRATPIKRT